MNEIEISLAVCDYDHVRDFVSGAVNAEGLRINFQSFSIQEIFHRFTSFREWDASEMSMGMYVALRSQGDDSLTAIPVFTSRMFRLSSFYINRNSSIKSAADLRGGKIGYPEWAHTAGIYSRAYLMHEIGIALEEIEWVQSGVNKGGIVEHVDLALPKSVRQTPVNEKSLDEMLIGGDIDALMSSAPPKSFYDGHPDIIRLFPDFEDVESTHYQQSGIFPIMHTIAIKRELTDEHPWITRNLFSAFDAAKNRATERLRDVTISRYPNPWNFAGAERAQSLFGKDIWPYGIEPNRITLDKFLQFCLEQGIAHRPMKVDELFAPNF
ncbi:MAG: 4,5-dihydroxyphthalate decarboxylase [Alphaproteobacteria bacterium]|tara:strand:+ start:126 stop:1097 length:972 start_codon:yes stop_codon:yes gene_type:complete